MSTHESDKPSMEFNEVVAGYPGHQPVSGPWTFSIKGPGIIRVRGNNGSGKTTFVELISGFFQPTHGEIFVCGISTKSDELEAVRSIMRTSSSLYPAMTVHDHLAFAARCRRVSQDHLFSRAERYGLEQRFHSSASELSTGNQRKLWLLCCTAAHRPVIALDEPFNGLDKAGIVVASGELMSWSEESLIFLIAHQMPEDLPIRGSLTVASTLDESGS